MHRTGYSSTDVVTLYLNTRFWRNVDGRVEENGASVPVSYAADAMIATINASIADALVTYAQTLWGWTLPRTNIISFALQKGLSVL